jgi:hypothetical protein
MAKSTDNIDQLALLRSEASQLLRAGTAPLAKSVLSHEVLDFLYKLANTSDGADDSLTLLHELQVHQVELDMQHEQIEANAREMAEYLNHYKASFDFAPVGYFIVSHEGRIIEANHAAAELFGIEIGEMQGCPVDSLLAVESLLSILGLLKRLRNGSRREVCEARTVGAAPRGLLVLASAPASADFYLLACVDTSDHR